MSQQTAYTDAILFTGEVFVEGHALLAADGNVLDIVAARKIPADAKRVECAGKILAPGFIDAQVNGGGNVQLNNAPTVEACLAIAAAHRKHGTAGLLLTCITDRPKIQHAAIAAVREARKRDASILGIHLEGPHLSPEARGIHKTEYIHALRDEDRAALHREGDEVALITVAPDVVSPEQITQLRAKGFIVSLGHTRAEPERVRAALAAGATGFTHLYNGMGGMSARGPGVAGAALDDRNSWCGIIADGHHVSAEMIRLAIRAKPPGKIFLVSDAMAPAGAEHPESFELYGEKIRVENGRCVNSEGKLAGSSITLADAVRHCIQNVKIDPAETLRMASLYPAEFLGVADRFGKLLPGYPAHVFALTPPLP